MRLLMVKASMSSSFSPAFTHSSNTTVKSSEFCLNHIRALPYLRAAAANQRVLRSDWPLKLMTLRCLHIHEHLTSPYETLSFIFNVLNIYPILKIYQLI